MLFRSVIIISLVLCICYKLNEVAGANTGTGRSSSVNGDQDLLIRIRTIDLKNTDDYFKLLQDVESYMHAGGITR